MADHEFIGLQAERVAPIDLWRGDIIYYDNQLLTVLVVHEGEGDPIVIETVNDGLVPIAANDAVLRFYND